MDKVPHKEPPEYSAPFSFACSADFLSFIECLVRFFVMVFVCLNLVRGRQVFLLYQPDCVDAMPSLMLFGWTGFFVVFIRFYFGFSFVFGS